MAAVPARPGAWLQDEEPAWAEIRPARTFESRPIGAESRKIGAGAPDEPTAGGVLGWTIVVVALIAGLAVAARRLLRRSALFAGGDAIRVLGRRALAPRQDLFLVEVGPRVFLLGASRERLVTLGEFARTEEIAQIRAQTASAGAAEQEFRAALRETLRDSETRPSPTPASSYSTVADELADIRKTVDGWRA